MNFNSKSQFFIFSGLFFLLLLIFIYSLETENNYIGKTSGVHLLDNIVHQACQVGINSNATNIANRYSNFTGEVWSYCQSLGNVCSLNISLKSGEPPGGNMSLLNYTHYNYQINYKFDEFSYQGNFTC